MKKIIFILCLISNLLFAQEYRLLRPSVGIGFIDGPYLNPKFHIIKLDNNEGAGLGLLGIGYSVGELSGATISPIQLEFNNIGVSFDYTIDSQMREASMSINYSF